ncbi:hypothetical protein [Serratia bockelmannii]|uniref:hypothetical protein n=1 Tax=Serratia bockelmannii TaxID=2703793 RepID=UPI003FA737B6
MKYIQWFGSITFAKGMVFFFMSSVGNNTRIVEPAFVMKEGAVLLPLNAIMKQNRQLDVQYQYSKGIFNQIEKKESYFP